MRSAFTSVRLALATAFAVAATTTSAAPAFAQADEIQVYTGGLAEKGTFNLTVHNNFSPNGVKTAAFPGGVIPDHSLNGVPEFAYGVSRWFEAGVYLPLYSVDKNSGLGLDGVKLRTLFAVPDGDNRTFVYGANFEFSYNARRWDQKRYSSEIRPILGLHLKPVDIVINPILDSEYDGFKNLDFAPSVRVALNVNARWAAAVEEYADYGPIRHFYSGNNQSHQLFAVVDYANKGWDIEAGAGEGLTTAADKFTLKLIVAHDLYHRKR